MTQQTLFNFNNPIGLDKDNKLTSVSLGEKESSYKCSLSKPELKFKNQTGSFILNNVLVNFEFQADKFGIPHFEFRSEQPNLLTSTGYLSYFCQADLTEYESMKEIIEDYIKAELNGKGYDLRWE